MNARQLLADLRARGITVRAEGGTLRVSAPRGALSEADRAALAEGKADLLAALTFEAKPETRDGVLRNENEKMNGGTSEASLQPLTYPIRITGLGSGASGAGDPLPEPAAEPAIGGAANAEAVSALLTWATANGWPKLPISQGAAIAAGETCWRTFLKRASPDTVLRASIAACQDDVEEGAL